MGLGERVHDKLARPDVLDVVPMKETGMEESRRDGYNG